MSARHLFAVTVAILLTVSFTAPVVAQTRIVTSVVGSGGIVHATSGTQASLSATIGQPLISGQRSSTQASIWEGFWTPVYNGTTSVDDGDVAVDDRLNVYPNPMHETARIAFDAQLEGLVSVRIYDAVGTLVQTVERMISLAGDMSVTITATDARGERLVSGAYICMVEGAMLGGTPYRASVRLSVLH